MDSSIYKPEIYYKIVMFFNHWGFIFVLYVMNPQYKLEHFAVRLHCFYYHRKYWNISVPLSTMYIVLQ